MEALTEFLEELDKPKPSVYFVEDTSSTSVSDWVDQQIQNTADFDVVIFSKEDCPFCQRALRLLTAMNEMANLSLRIKVYDLNVTDSKLIQPLLKKRTGQSTVPNIFMEGKHIGGYDKLCEMFKSIVLSAEASDSKNE